MYEIDIDKIYLNLVCRVLVYLFLLILLKPRCWKQRVDSSIIIFDLFFFLNNFF